MISWEGEIQKKFGKYFVNLNDREKRIIEMVENDIKIVESKSHHVI